MCQFADFHMKNRKPPHRRKRICRIQRNPVILANFNVYCVQPSQLQRSMAAGDGNKIYRLSAKTAATLEKGASGNQWSVRGSNKKGNRFGWLQNSRGAGTQPGFNRSLCVRTPPPSLNQTPYLQRADNKQSLNRNKTKRQCFIRIVGLRCIFSLHFLLPLPMWSPNSERKLTGGIK